MADLFLRIADISLSASLIAVIVIFLRFLLRNSPRWAIVLLWGIVAFRLICPLSIELKLPISVGDGEGVYEWINEISRVWDDIQAVFDDFVAVLRESFSVGELGPVMVTGKQSRLSIITVLSYVWVTGLIALLIHAVLGYRKLNQMVARSERYRDNIYLADCIVSPFTLGVLKPKIYLPSEMRMPDLEYAIMHEQAHICRKDHWWKLIGFLLRSIHWFNPLIWLSYNLLCLDIELSCDERVIRSLGKAQRVDYSQALLNTSVYRRTISV